MRTLFNRYYLIAAGIPTLFTLAACAPAAIVQPGDRVEISFTCRLTDGLLAATTRPDKDVAAESKSSLYLPRNGSDSIKVTAGGPAKNAERQDRIPFEQEILNSLALRLPGMTEGQQAEWELTAERYPEVSPKERVVRMATIRKRQKELRISREEYTTKFGREPAQGQSLVLDPLVPGTVNEVTEKDVLIKFAPLQGKPLVTPFGPVTLRETPENYELMIATEKGRLVRLGGMVGRIIEVENDSFAIDLGHPFGGEKLDCRVKVDGVERTAAALPTAAAVEPTVTDPAAVSNLLLENAMKFQQEQTKESLKAAPLQAAPMESH